MTSDKEKNSVKTPWGDLLKAKGIEEKFLSLNKELEEIKSNIEELDKNKTSELPDMDFSKDSKKVDVDISKLGVRIDKIEAELKNIKDFQSLIKEKFELLSNQIIKKLGPE